jgi:hypothetical protein
VRILVRKRGTEESNLEQRFWRPLCFRYTSAPGRPSLEAVTAVRLSLLGTYVRMRRRSASEFASVMTLMELGRSDYQIAQLTGVPRSTVGAWRHGRGLFRHQREASARPDWRPRSPASYSYLLGAYLGDGCISVFSPRAAALVITLDSTYPVIIDEVETAARTVFPDIRVSRYLRIGGSVTAVRVCHPALPFAFPQHGAGRKHKREIRLTEWQRELTHAHPKELLRGLIHSDGCRTVNRFKTKLPSGRVAEYEYPRYFFSNLSADIRAIFCEHCDLLGIRWTQSNPRNISVSHRNSVALVDQFVGPKA